MRRDLGLKGGFVAVLAGALLIASAGSSTTPSGNAVGKPITIGVTGLKHNHAKVLDRIRIQGQLTPAAPGDRVTIRGFTGKHRRAFVKKVATNPTTGTFGMPLSILRCCKYRIEATHGSDSAATSFRVRVPNIGNKSRGPLVKYFNKLMRRQGYYDPQTKRFGYTNGLAVLAFRKVNKMARTMKVDKKIFRKLLTGHGAFHLKHKKGKHVEVDLSRQVMVLARGGKPRHTFHISSGAPWSPTVRGKFHFYRKDPGYNAKAMYYSAYFVGGYATHGYDPVPTYNASHGCVRNPIPFSVFIYNWINLGDTIYVYN